MRLSLSILFVFLFNLPTAQANKLDVFVGAYSFSAKTYEAKGSDGGLGAYKINYSRELLGDVDLSIGYTVIMSGIVGGDLGFGLDVGFDYFPLTPGRRINIKSSSSDFKIYPLYRPFGGVYFHQRQFQSVSTNYAGFGLAVGFERTLDYFTDLKMSLRYANLTGPNTSTASELTVFCGVTFLF